MRRKLQTGIATMAHVVAALVLMTGQLAWGKTLDVKSILAKCDGAEGFENNFAEMRQIITTTGGEKRTLVLRAWAVNNGEKQLAEYLTPADIKGQKILMTDFGDNIWMFNPVTRRTRKLGSHMRKKKVMGSDFTYEDQAGGRISQKYTGDVRGTEQMSGVPAWVVELEPTPEGPSYDKIVAWIGKADYMIRRVDYYQDGDSQPFKRLIAEDIRTVGGKRVPFKMTMTNLEDRTETVNEIVSIRFDAKVPASIFESRNLEK
ncbi:outer membrane lipoprotein-sorting protein [Myxococcota bacterium]